MLYRVHQFIQALFPRLQPDEIQWVKEILPPPAFILFQKQKAAEQRHAINVAKSIKRNKENYQGISEHEYENLLITAFLHDCGKSLTPIRLWYKIAIVFLQKLPVQIQNKLEQEKGPLNKPLRIASHHAEWGETLARQKGLNPDICSLIRQHHTPETLLGRILQEADNEN